MDPMEKELEDRLKDVGIRLASPPSVVDELLCLLDQTEIYLSRVEQSPSTSMSDALRPAMDSLVTKEYLNHPEADVKVFVAACINEITRITAPDAPYNDSLMKEIFAVIVDAFGKLDDISGPSFSKRVSILETVAKVRSCVVMLDLECDDLILQMFKHFLNCIQPDHSINVFSSMETIMTLVLEDSEDISQELLHCLLTNALNSKKETMPVACRLAEKVISNCATKLKPCLSVAVKSMGTVSSDYGDIVASICHDCSVAPEQNEADETKLLPRTVSDELPQTSDKVDKAGPEELGTLTDKTRKVMSNGVVPFENGNPIAETNSPEFKTENHISNEQCKNVTSPRGENSKSGSITEKPVHELDLKYVEAKSSSVQLTDASDSSRVDGDKEASSPTIRRAGRKRKTIGSMKSNGASDMVQETEALMKPKRAVELRPLEGLVGDSASVVPVITGDIHPNSGPKTEEATRSQFSAKRSATRKTVPSASKKKKSQNTRMEIESSLDIASEHKEDHCVVGNLDEKPSQGSAKKSLEDNTTPVVLSDGKSFIKGQNESVKKVDVSISSRKQVKSSIKQQEKKDIAEGDVPAEKSLKEMIVSSNNSREVNDDELQFGKLAETSSRKKRRRKTSGWKIFTGRRIEVWWPDDAMFYNGVITEFDPVTEKHKILYDDGDVEFLLLANERWNYIDSDNPEKGQKDHIASPKSSVQELKKPRESSGKSKAAPKATPEIDGSAAESKGLSIQQPHGRNSAVKSRGRHKQETSKVGTPSIDKTPASYASDETKVEQSHGGKSVAKPRGRTKQETPASFASDAAKAEKSRGGRKSTAISLEKSVGKSRARHRKETTETSPSPIEKTQETRSNDGSKAEDSHAEKSPVKSRGIARRKTSKKGSPLTEKAKQSSNIDGRKAGESPLANKTTERPEDNTSNKVDLLSGVGKTGVTSRRRSKGGKNEVAAIEPSQTEVSADDDTLREAPLVKDGIVTAAELSRESEGKLAERFRGRKGRRERKPALKSTTAKPKTSSISTQTENLDDPLTDTPKSVVSAKEAEIGTNEKSEPLESNSDAKVRGKRKSSASRITDANVSAIKTSEGKEADAGTSKSAAKPNKRRRRK